jgi:hypothetical protein
MGGPVDAPFAEGPNVGGRHDVERVNAHIDGISRDPETLAFPSEPCPMHHRG